MTDEEIRHYDEKWARMSAEIDRLKSRYDEAFETMTAAVSETRTQKDLNATLTSREAELVGEVEECDRALQHQVDRVEAAEAESAALRTAARFDEIAKGGLHDALEAAEAEVERLIACLARTELECGCGKHVWVCMECHHQPMSKKLEAAEAIAERRGEAIRDYLAKRDVAMGADRSYKSTSYMLAIGDLDQAVSELRAALNEPTDGESAGDSSDG